MFCSHSRKHSIDKIIRCFFESHIRFLKSDKIYVTGLTQLPSALMGRPVAQRCVSLYHRPVSAFHFPNLFLLTGRRWTSSSSRIIILSGSYFEGRAFCARLKSGFHFLLVLAQLKSQFTLDKRLRINDGFAQWTSMHSVPFFIAISFGSVICSFIIHLCRQPDM